MVGKASFAWVVCAGILSAAAPDADLSRAQATMARLPLRFEENRGQGSPQARFLARGGGYNLEMTAQGPAMAVGTKRVDLQLVRSNPSPAIQGEGRMAAATNYFVGS